MNRRGLTCLEIIVVVAVLAVLAGLLLPTGTNSIRNAKTTQCCNHLAQLWKMQYNYSAQFGGKQKRMPAETGDAFWLTLSRPPTVLIDSTLMEIYSCPLEGAEDGCDYRGPAEDVNQYGDRDPVGADVDGNHGESGGNVLRKSGDVVTVGPEDPLWALAARRTNGGSPACYTGRSRIHKRPQEWMFLVVVSVLGLMLVVEVLRPKRVDGRPGAFWTTILALSFSALYLWGASRVIC